MIQYQHDITPPSQLYRHTQSRLKNAFTYPSHTLYLLLGTCIKLQHIAYFRSTSIYILLMQRCFLPLHNTENFHVMSVPNRSLLILNTKLSYSFTLDTSQHLHLMKTTQGNLSHGLLGLTHNVNFTTVSKHPSTQTSLQLIIYISPLTVLTKTIRLFGWLGFNGTFCTNTPYRAIGKLTVC